MRIAIRLLFFIGIFVFTVFFIASVFFNGWRTQRFETLIAGSELIETPAGSVEVFDSQTSLPTIAVLHGGAGGYDQGVAISDFLSRDFRIIAISRPGYLRTPLASGILMEQQADLLASLLQQKGISSAHLLAIGEGAAPALLAAQRHPNSFEKIVLLSPNTIRDHTKIPALFALENISGDLASWFYNLSLSFSPSSFLTSLFQTETSLPAYECFKLAESTTSHSDSLAWMQKFFLSISPISPRETGCRNDITQLSTLPDPAFASILHPTLLVFGKADIVASPKNASTLPTALRNSQTLFIENSGYILPGACPEPQKTQKTILEFLRPSPEKK